MKNRTYHIGLLANNTDKCYLLQVVTNKDCLSCGIIKYFGKRLTTKKQLNQNRAQLLKEFNNMCNRSYDKLIIR